MTGDGCVERGTAGGGDGGVAELGYAFDTLGADGVIVETNAHGVYLGDQRLEPVFAELARRRATVLVHPTSPPCWQQTALGRPRPMIEFIFDTARAVTGLILAGTLTRHPGMNIIVPHGGGALPLLADPHQGLLVRVPVAARPGTRPDGPAAPSVLRPGRTRSPSGSRATQPANGTSRTLTAPPERLPQGRVRNRADAAAYMARHESRRQDGRKLRQ